MGDPIFKIGSEKMNNRTTVPYGTQNMDYFQAMKLDEAFGDFIFQKEVENKAERTLFDHRTHFRYFKEYLSEIKMENPYVHQINRTICKGYYRYMYKKKLSSNTMRIRTKSIKAQFQYYQDEHFILVNPWGELLKEIKEVEKDPVTYYNISK